MSTCTAIVDYEENADIECGAPAEFMCCGEPRCAQCAHDWLDELEPSVIHTVSALWEAPTDQYRLNPVTGD